jgi:RNA polymerase sigma-70 factor (ECF subfamily)
MMGTDVRTDPSPDEYPSVEALYDTYGRLVFSLALRILREVGDAEDVVQDVFVQAWVQRGRYDPGRGRVAAWLLVITRSRAIDKVRARRGDRRASDRVPCHVDDLPAPKAADVDDLRLVRDAMTRLGIDQRRALELAYFDGYTHVEIAGILNQPLGTIKTRIRSAMWHLRDYVQPRGTRPPAPHRGAPSLDPATLRPVLLPVPNTATIKRLE